ncbi:MAG: exo-alpha-sialidase [Runella sp.]
MKLLSLSFVLALVCSFSFANPPTVTVLKSGFIYEKAPFPSCHASTIVELKPNHLMAAWFGGTDEGEPDVGIWIADCKNGNWSTPRQIAIDTLNGKHRYPCWNPVLFKTKEGKLMLFYKVGPSPREWWGMWRISANDGKTWSAPTRLPNGMLGPIKNKPIQLPNGDILYPTSTESLDERVWHVHLEKSDKNGQNWQKITLDNGNFGAIQPSILRYANGKMQILCRSRQGAVVESWSYDGGKSWTALQKTSLPNPNAGTDAVTLRNSTQILVYNPIKKGRHKLVVAASHDGVHWQDIHVLEDSQGEFSYPAVIQTSNNNIEITYTHQRKHIKHVSLRVADVLPPLPVGPVPTKAQLAWHQMELNAFVHFTTNTFTDLEWGYGDEKPSIFNPTAMNVEQWAETFQKAGFKGVILTCKHHDGFCLFPSQYTAHSVKNSPYRGGKGDVVREVADACKKFGLKFGVYLSPWDRNHPEYGRTAYVEYYRNQLKEVFTNYGPVFEMWFDGANGGDGYYGGAREKRRIDGQTYYDWPTTLDQIRAIAPDVIFFSDAGPGVRWCGNERGIAGETNWNTITPDTLYAGKAGIEQLLNTGSEDGTHWIPSEVDVSIRPGWFYHASEDDKVRSPQNLMEIYLSSVGRGSTLLLNVPPDRRGLLHEKDVKSLLEWRALLDQTFSTNLAANAKVEASHTRGRDFGASYLTDQNPNTYWAAHDGTTTATLTLTLGKDECCIQFLKLKEYIALGQRVKAFYVEGYHSKTKQWKKIAEGTTIGYQRILKINAFNMRKLRIHITAAKASPVLSEIAVY